MFDREKEGRKVRELMAELAYMLVVILGMIAGFALHVVLRGCK